MRITSAIDRPIKDEHVIGTDPPLRPELPGVWRRRINPFLGRSLSDRALTAEQEVRAGIQRLRGQGVTAGVVSGLDVLLEPGARSAAAGLAVLQILPGQGLTQSGEDVSVSSTRRIRLGDLPVFARVDHLDAIANDDPPSGRDPDAPEPDPETAPPSDGVMTGLRPRLPRRTGPTFGRIITRAAAADLPRVAVLVAEPITATILGRPGDTCPRDPRDEPYDDLQLIDGCRLVLAFWPAEMVAIAGGPDYSMPPMGPTRRNALAYRAFNVERRMAQGEYHPWEDVGVPLALIGFNDDWTLDFIDRAAVMRMGGQPNPRTPLVTRSGTPILWQARVSQFVEHLSELPDLTPATLAAAMRHLPPIGFLPADVIDIPTRRQHFFPAGFTLSAAPVPLEQLDVLMRDSASLIPINLDASDAVELLVPVPDRVYEPGLLETAEVDPAFARAITRYTADRTQWLIRREMVRRRRDLQMDAATGKRARWPASDLPAEEALPYPTTRPPVTATRVRKVDEGVGRRVLQMRHAKSSLDLADTDRIYMWVRVASPDGLTGFSLAFGERATYDANGQFLYGVFWGMKDGLPLGGDPIVGPSQRRGDIPATGRWVRLEFPANATWHPGGETIGGMSFEGIEFAQVGGTIEWGPMGRIDSEGNDTVWIGDDAPQHAVLMDSAFGLVPGDWPWAPADILETPEEADFGTMREGGTRSSVALDKFLDRWDSATFLQPDLDELHERGIDGFDALVRPRLKATNDAIDLGFVRARTDIYRVRQFMLGADAASRLVTSPALADVATRDEGARATNEKLSDFLRSAYETNFRRDPANPLRPQATTVVVPPPPRTVAGTANTMFMTPMDANVARSVRVAPAFVPRTAAATTGFFVPPPASAVNTGIGTRVAPAYVPPPGVLPSVTAYIAPPSAGSIASYFTAATGARAFSTRDVTSQLPLPGAVERTASVAERLVLAPAVQAHQAALAGKLAVINAIAGLLEMDGERPRGIALGDLPSVGYTLLPGKTRPAGMANTIADVIADMNLPQNARSYQDSDQLAEASATHEADYFRAAVATIDNTIALMRLVEGRVDLYQRMLDDAQSVRETLMQNVAAADTRLRLIDTELAEARHDLGVAMALLAEERERVDALNTRRRAILKEHAKMIVFRRPRRAPHTWSVPTAPATSLLVEAPVTVCLREHDDVPEEIRDYAALFRDAPVAWFPAVKQRMDLLDRLDAARAALLAARLRAQMGWPYFGYVPSSTQPRFLSAVYAAIAAQREVMDRRRQYAAQLDYSVLQSVNLLIARQTVIEAASMADLIAGDHNRPVLARMAATEIESIGQIAGCLHESFAEVPPVIRMEWAEMLSAFDNPAPLHRLAGLPDWSTLPLETRRTQQGFVDWLFSRIDRSITDAESAMNELIRVCLLMAAHAPVDRLIPARLVAPAPARLGASLDLALDARLARIGMMAVVRDAQAQPIAHAVIENLEDGMARARITRSFQSVATIPLSARIELTRAFLR